MSIALGTLPDWFSGVGTLGALGFAAGALRAAISANRRQDQQIKFLTDAEADRVERERRSQASQIAMWFDLDEQNSPAIFYSNRSGLPIHNVHTLVKSPWGHTITRFSILGPTSDKPRILHRVIEDIATQSGGAMFRGKIGYQIDEKYLILGQIEGWPDVIYRGSIVIGFAFKDTNEIP